MEGLQESDWLALYSATNTVSLAKLGRQLRREASTNPKKAVFLGVAALVAIYFWAPLVWGWIGKKNDKDVSVAVASSGTTSAIAPVAAPDSKATPKDAGADRLPWPKIAQLMHEDSRTMTAPPLTITRDPFESPRAKMVELMAEVEEKSSPKPPVITPSAAGLVLASTIIGPQRRIAQINGRIYAVGQSVEAVKDKEAVGLAFKLVEVHSRRAILEADGQRFELTIPEPDESSNIEFRGAADKH